MDQASKIQELLNLPMHLCSKCGLCCKVNIFKGGLPLKAIEKIAKDNTNTYNAQLAQEFLNLHTVINTEEARNIAPCFVKTLESMWGKDKDKVTFFKCKFINNNTNLCDNYDNRPKLCKIYPTPQATTIYHPNCAFKETGEKNWQEILKIINELNELQDKLNKEKEFAIEEAKKESETSSYADMYTLPIPPPPSHLCNNCGKCCKAAINRNSYERIKEMSAKGISEAVDFLSIFEPYESVDDAKNVVAEHVEQLQKLVGYRYDNLTLYHCKYITENNLCSIYERRPKVCMDAPNEAWAIIPPGCGYYGWLFELREHAKKYVRALKQYLYFKQATSLNNKAEKVPVKAICDLNIEDIDPWKPFIFTL
ncbi:MAG: YkgJ family cysteine cluster protein, partial [Cyanobacteriota bacterium]